MSLADVNIARFSTFLFNTFRCGLHETWEEIKILVLDLLAASFRKKLFFFSPLWSKQGHKSVFDPFYFGSHALANGQWPLLWSLRLLSPLLVVAADQVPGPHKGMSSVSRARMGFSGAWVGQASVVDHAVMANKSSRHVFWLLYACNSCDSCATCPLQFVKLLPWSTAPQWAAICLLCAKELLCGV